MQEHDKNKADLISELLALRQEVAQLRAAGLPNRTKLAQTLAHAEQHTHRLDQLNHLALLLSQAPDKEAAFRAVAYHLSHIVGSDRSSLALVNEAGTHAELFVMDGEMGKIPTGTQLPLAGTNIGDVIEKNNFIVQMICEKNNLDSRTKWLRWVSYLR